MIIPVVKWYIQPFPRRSTCGQQILPTASLPRSCSKPLRGCSRHADSTHQAHQCGTLSLRRQHLCIYPKGYLSPRQKPQTGQPSEFLCSHLLLEPFRIHGKKKSSELVFEQQLTLEFFSPIARLQTSLQQSLIAIAIIHCGYFCCQYASWIRKPHTH